MRRPVNAQRQAGHDSQARLCEGCAELTRVRESLGRGISAADDGDGIRPERIDRTLEKPIVDSPATGQTIIILGQDGQPAK